MPATREGDCGVDRGATAPLTTCGNVRMQSQSSRDLRTAVRAQMEDEVSIEGTDCSPVGRSLGYLARCCSSASRSGVTSVITQPPLSVSSKSAVIRSSSHQLL